MAEAVRDAAEQAMPAWAGNHRQRSTPLAEVRVVESATADYLLLVF